VCGFIILLQFCTVVQINYKTGNLVDIIGRKNTAGFVDYQILYEHLFDGFLFAAAFAPVGDALVILMEGTVSGCAAHTDHCGFAMPAGKLILPV